MDSSNRPTNPGLISIIDSADEVAKKVKRAVTDSNPVIFYDPQERPEISNLIGLYCALTNQSVTDVEPVLQNLDTLGLKKIIIEVVNDTLNPIRDAQNTIYVTIGSIISAKAI